MSTPTTTQEAPPPQPGDRVAVLLVDDQIIIGEAVRRILATQKGIEFIFCQDGQAALAQAATSNPTVILQDLVMPGVDGLDLVRGYRSQQVTAETPIIVLSSKEEGATKAAAFSAGANDYIVKLPDPLELLARIRYHSRAFEAQLRAKALARRTHQAGLWRVRQRLQLQAIGGR